MLVDGFGGINGAGGCKTASAPQYRAKEKLITTNQELKKLFHL